MSSPVLPDPFSVMTSFNWAIISSSMLCAYAGYSENSQATAIDKFKKDIRYCRERYDYLASINVPPSLLIRLVYIIRKAKVPDKPKSALPITMGFFSVICVIAVCQLVAVLMFWWANSHEFAFNNYKYPSVLISLLMVSFLLLFAWRIWNISSTHKYLNKWSNEINDTMKDLSDARFNLTK